MAFTVAHMAAALPFYRCRRWLSFEALLIGTMLPDLPYFLNSDASVGQQSHQWIGVLSYCLPWGLLVFALWHWLLKPAVIALIQPWYKAQHFDSHYFDSHLKQQRMARYSFGFSLLSRFRVGLAFWLKVTLGLLLGAATHLIWDGITHVDSFIAEQIAWLQYSLDIRYLGDMTVARILQYVSSLLGLMLLFRFAWLKFIEWRFTSPNLNKQSVRILDLFSLSHSPLLKKRHSIFIVGSMSLSSLYWGLQAALKWRNLLITDQYLFRAKILVGLLQGAVGLFVIYAVAYQLLYRVRHPHLLRNRNC